VTCGVTGDSNFDGVTGTIGTEDVVDCVFCSGELFPSCWSISCTLSSTLGAVSLTTDSSLFVSMATGLGTLAFGS